MGLRRIYQLALAAGAALSLCLLLTACGESRHSAESEQSTTLAEAGAAPVESMTADSMPLSVGSRLVFDATSPGKPVDLSFSLEGPWDFTKNATAVTLTMETVKPESAISAKEFSQASVAVLSYWSPGPQYKEYNFQDKGEDAWLSYGKSSQEGRFVTYSNPSRALVFPVMVGNHWTESYSEVEDGKTVEITAENTIVSRNNLRVPAGSFDSYLLQTKVSATRAGKTNVTWDYTWFVPGIGRAAEIISQPNETRQPFTRAIAFYRLKSYEIR